MRFDLKIHSLQLLDGLNINGRSHFMVISRTPQEALKSFNSEMMVRIPENHVLIVEVPERYLVVKPRSGKSLPKNYYDSITKVIG